MLNERFLTLASMLPPLATIRRPSKAAIVHTSITTVNAALPPRSRRADFAALSREAENMRREINEWRAHARVPHMDAPVRSEAHAANVRADVEGSSSSRRTRRSRGTKITTPAITITARRSSTRAAAVRRLNPITSHSTSSLRIRRALLVVAERTAPPCVCARAPGAVFPSQSTPPFSMGSATTTGSKHYSCSAALLARRRRPAQRA
ncbi:hypothetical protein DFH06DRAFT_69104 [Mycena polygramma]|nr:hypothetical protein DFH06DRAFT_69104 [Mycena polygramma]